MKSTIKWPSFSIWPERKGTKVQIFSMAELHRQAFYSFIEENRDYHEPWVYHQQDDRYFDAYLLGNKKGSCKSFFIFKLEGNELVGIVNINNIMRGSLSMASLGYYGCAEYGGRGYMREGLELVIDYAFHDLGLNRLEANIQPNNFVSKHLIKRLGFRYEGYSVNYLKINGVWCDHERYALLHDDYRPIS